MSFSLISDSKWEAADHMVPSRRLISIAYSAKFMNIYDLVWKQ